MFEWDECPRMNGLDDSELLSRMSVLMTNEIPSVRSTLFSSEKECSRQLQGNVSL